jgi:hypothetical protein
VAFICAVMFRLKGSGGKSPLRLGLVGRTGFVNRMGSCRRCHEAQGRNHCLLASVRSGKGTVQMISSRCMLTGWMSLALIGGCFGCSSQPISGVVEEQPALSAGSSAYDIPFTASDGKRITLHAIRQPVTILAFVDTAGDACCVVRPEAADLAVEFMRLPVTVVHVSRQTGVCAHSSGQRQMGPLKKSDPVVLCDPNRVAWEGFGRPSSGTLVLIDRRGIIAGISDMGGLTAFSRKAERLALEEMNRHLD